MAKVKINSKIKNISLNEEVATICWGILRDHKIIYKDEDAIYEVMIQKKDILFVKKRSDGVQMEFHFKENTSNYVSVIGNGYTTKIPLLTEEVNIEKNKIEIFYQLDSNERFLFCLIYE